MEVYIKGMEMPKSCVDCHDKGVCNHINALVYCPWCRDIIDPALYALSGKRHPDCPLVELPPHGRLIDADALKKIVADPKHMDAGIYNGRTLYSDHLCVGADYDDVCAAIDETPTVIEAEEGASND